MGVVSDIRKSLPATHAFLALGLSESNPHTLGLWHSEGIVGAGVADEQNVGRDTDSCEVHRLQRGAPLRVAHMHHRRSL